MNFSNSDQFRSFDDQYGNFFACKKTTLLESGVWTWEIIVMAKGLKQPRKVGTYIESQPQGIYSLYTPNLKELIKKNWSVVYSVAIIDHLLPDDTIVVRYDDTLKISTTTPVVRKHSMLVKEEASIPNNPELGIWKRDVYKLSSEHFQVITNQLTI